MFISRQEKQQIIEMFAMLREINDNLLRRIKELEQFKREATSLFVTRSDAMSDMAKEVKILKEKRDV